MEMLISFVLLVIWKLWESRQLIFGQAILCRFLDLRCEMGLAKTEMLDNLGSTRSFAKLVCSDGRFGNSGIDDLVGCHAMSDGIVSACRLKVIGREINLQA